MVRNVTGGGKGARRQELLDTAAELFAQRGFTNTSIRDIASKAGIMPGSLYYHFDSKESIVDEILSSFQTGLLATYDDIVKSDLDVRAKVEGVVRVSFTAIDEHHAEVAIFQNDANHLMRFARFDYLHAHNARFRELWIGLLADGIASGALRPDLDIELVFRFIRDTVWVAVNWYRPGGELSARQVADQYLTILLDGIAGPPAGGASDPRDQGEEHA